MTEYLTGIGQIWPTLGGRFQVTACCPTCRWLVTLRGDHPHEMQPFIAARLIEHVDTLHVDRARTA